MECLLKLEAHLLSILAHGGEECHAHEWIITGQWRIHTIYGTLSTLRYLYLNPLRLRFLIFFPGLPLFFQRLANRESCGNNAINNNNRTDRSVYKLTVTISAISLFDQFFVGWTDSDCVVLSKSVDPPPWPRLPRWSLPGHCGTCFLKGWRPHGSQFSPIENLLYHFSLAY